MTETDDEKHAAELRADLDKAVDEINAYYKELYSESSRVAAILAVSSLEEELESLLLAKFPRTLTPQLWKALAGPGPSPLGNFKARILLGQAFGFYGPKTSKLLERLAGVRNRFAHRIDVRDFKHPEILQKCVALAANPVLLLRFPPDISEADIRLNFVTLVQRTAIRLEAIKSHFLFPEEPPPNPLP